MSSEAYLPLSSQANPWQKSRQKIQISIIIFHWKQPKPRKNNKVVIKKDTQFNTRWDFHRYLQFLSKTSKFFQIIVELQLLSKTSSCSAKYPSHHHWMYNYPPNLLMLRFKFGQTTLHSPSSVSLVLPTMVTNSIIAMPR